MAQDFANQRLGVNVSAGNTMAQTGTVVMSNANGISFGMSLSASSNVITASYTVPAAPAALAISAAGASASSGTVVFNNLNGVSFGMNGSTVTAALVQVKYFDNHAKAALAANAVLGSSNAVNLSIQRIVAPFQISATELDLLAHLTVAGSTAGSYTISAALYTFNGSTASSVSSSSVAVTFNSGTQSNAGGSIYGAQSGTRWRTMPIGTWNLTLGEYLLGVMVSIAGVAGTTGSMTMYGGSAVSVLNDVGVTIGRSAYFADGLYTAATSGFPASMHLSDVLQSGAAALRQPYFRLVGTL